MVARGDPRSIPAESGDHDVRQVEQSLRITPCPLLDELELVVVADDDPRSRGAVGHIRAVHHRKLVRGVEDERHTALTALDHEALHCPRIVRADDHRIDMRRSVVETQHRGAPHRTSVVAGQLVVVHVGGGEARGAHLALQQAQPTAVDALRHQPVAILRRVAPRGREHGRRTPQQREVVGVVAGHATPPLLQVVDQEAEV